MSAAANQGPAGSTPPTSSTPPASSTPMEVFLAFLRLGLTSFGGPVAHIGYFRTEFVARRRWLDDAAYAEYVALAQFLPGPASSQVGLALGAHRAGLPGSLAAWLGFTLPSAVVMIALGLGIGALGDGRLGGGQLGAIESDALLHGLKLVAVAVVIQALWQMANQLCPDRLRLGFAVVATAVALLLPAVVGHLAAMVLGALAGLLLLRPKGALEGGDSGAVAWRHEAFSRWCLRGFFILLGGLPIAAWLFGVPLFEMVERFYRAGALVFGGGHVVLPLLESGTVAPGWVDKGAFLAGYGAAQALPGPLFTFAGYLGALPGMPVGGPAGGLIGILAVFLPSFLLVFGILPRWAGLRRRRGVVAAVRGTNAAVVGVLLAALYDPLWTGAVFGAADFAFVMGALGLLALARVPPWAVVCLGALGGGAFGLH